MKKIIFLTIVSLSIHFVARISSANEMILTAEEARAQGFMPVEYSRFPVRHYFIVYDQNIKWPFELPYLRSLMGNSFNQYQPYELPGYHQGCDMILESHSWVYAPVNGRLEAGHYSYTLKANGDRIKQWKAWPADGDKNYFELSVVDADGTRFELHHIERDSLPNEILELLNGTSPMVQAGQKLGQVHSWPTPFHYDHIHVNVITSQGIALNPESIYETIPDTKPPEVKFLAIYKTGRTEWVQSGVHFTQPVDTIAVIGADEKNESTYVQAPTKLELLQNDVVVQSLDFSKSLLDAAGNFTDIHNVYPQYIQSPEGHLMTQMKDPYPRKGTKFNMILSVENAMPNENFILKVEDAAGNTTSLEGKF